MPGQRAWNRVPCHIQWHMQSHTRSRNPQLKQDSWKMERQIGTTARKGKSSQHRRRHTSPYKKAIHNTWSTVNEPGRLGDQSRWMGRIHSRITIDVIERLWSNWSLKRFMTKVKMRMKSPIHATIKPPDNQSSNYNSSCTMKEANTNISQQLKYSNWYEDIQSWRFGNLMPRRCCRLNWFQIFINNK